MLLARLIASGLVGFVLYLVILGLEFLFIGEFSPERNVQTIRDSLMLAGGYFIGSDPRAWRRER